MTKRVWWMLVPAVAITACSGGGDDAVSTADWCSIAQQVADADLAVEAIGDDPASAKAAFDELRALFDEAAKAAPDEILADVNTVADGVDRIAKIADGVEYDLAAADESAIGEIDRIAGRLGDASARIAAYDERECDIEAAPTIAAASTTAPTTTPTTPTTDTADTGAPSSTPDATDPDREPVFTGDPDSEWCGLARQIEARADELDAAVVGEPEEVEQYFQEFIADLEEAAAVAPPEIADEVERSLEGARRLDEAFAAADYDLLRADLSVMAELDATMTDAEDTIEQYNSDVCGIEPTDDESSDDSSDFDPTAGSVRDQTITELQRLGLTEEQAGCVFDAIDFTDPNVGDDLNAMLAIFEQCGVDPTTLVPGD